MRRVLSFLVLLVTINLYSDFIDYRVKYGDTLYSIALNNKTSIDQIVKDNNLKDKKIDVNQVLKIYPNSIDFYFVESGDTLSGIAYKKGIQLETLLKLNKLKENHILKVGEKLSVVKNTPEVRVASVLLPDEIKIKPKSHTTIYTVKKGDTLFRITREFDCSLEELKDLNSLNSNDLKIGQKLNIPVKLNSYTVKKGDTLLEIAIRFNTTTEILSEINSLNNENLRIEQKIKLPYGSEGEPESKVTIKSESNKTHKVKKGDTISAIALEYQTTEEDILKLNSLENDKIYLGQTIKLPDYAKKREPLDYYIYHNVVKGDTLSGISVKYDISETLLRELNNLKNDSIKVGDKLKLIPQNSRIHEVKKGDTLWSIAKKYNVSVDQLMQYNHLNTTKVTVGKKINIYDYRVAEHIATGVIPKSTTAREPSIKLASFEFGKNHSESQLYRNYSINELVNPINKYFSAHKKWVSFDTSISKEKTLSNFLDGWTIVLDPGHGGKDPGAIATVKTNNKKLHIVEDEYAYDTSLRLYELLKRHGADVYMTILSPDHLTRNPVDDSFTFVNGKNEVYNNKKLNQINNITVWPVGGQWGLNQRVLITNNIIKEKKSKTLFISIHADNDIDRGKGKLVLYHSNGYGEDTQSKNFAKQLISTMGSDAIIKSMDLAVLRGNNSKYKVLIELRNMAHLSEALDLLDKNKRQEDAQMILEGIKSYIKE